MKTLCLILLFHVSLQLQCDRTRISAWIGGEFVIACRYEASRYLFSKKYWCRGSSRNSCEILMDSDGLIKSHRSQIVDAGDKGLFVQVSNLQLGDSGDYWIGIDKVYADLMVPVSVVVTDVPVSRPRLWPLDSLVNRQTCWGESVTVRCGCERGTGVLYTWHQLSHSEDFLLQRSADLSLDCSSVRSGGQFYCSATNSISRERSDVLSVHVLVPANSSCIYAVNIQGQPVYDCLDRLTTTTAEGPLLTTGIDPEQTEIQSDTREPSLQTNQTHLDWFLSRTWSGVPLWYALLRWGSFASLLLTVCVAHSCVKTRRRDSVRKKKRAHRRQSPRVAR